MKQVTERQQEVLDFIKDFIARFKFPPTVREIATHFGISVKGAYDHVKALNKKGLIRCNSNRSRAIEVLGQEEEGVPEQEVVRVPVVGHVAAGLPLLAEENQDGTMSVPGEALQDSKPHFALRVEGDSMVDAGIHDGDMAVFVQQPTADNGEIVVAMVEDAVTLKRFYQEKNRVRLKSENTDYPPIYSKDVRILGKLVHLTRSYV